MRVIVIGCSKVGKSLIKYLCKEGHDVVVIDKNAYSIDLITDSYDCNGYVGNGSSNALLQKAGIASTSLVIAVTKDDETNILCCNIAKKLGVKKTVAAVRNPEYNADRSFLKERMGVDSIVNPERMAAKELSQRLVFSNGIYVERFGEENASVATIVVEADSVLDKIKISDFKNKISQTALVCAIERKKKVITPKGDSQIHANDIITVVAPSEEMKTFLDKIGVSQSKLNNVMVVGGSRLGYYLTEIMNENGINVSLVDSNADYCRELLEVFPKVNVIHGDGVNAEFLNAELKDKDACISVTGKDEQNLIISMYAKSMGISRVATEIDNADYAKMLKSSGVSHIFSTQEVAVSGVLKSARGIEVNATEEDGIKWMYLLNGGKVEAVEFQVTEQFSLCDVQFKDSKFSIKKGVLVALIIRNGQTIVPDGNSTIKSGDRIIVVSADVKLTKINDIVD